MDFQYRWVDKDNTYKTGFQIYDGAFYLQRTLNSSSQFFMDVPFGSVPPQVNAGDVDSSSDIELWREKAQLYLSHKINKTSFYFGQFDSVYGVEANDTIHNPLPIEGLVAQLMPAVHRGVMVQHEARGVTTDFIVGNQESSGYDKKKPLEWGVNFFKKWESIHASLGYLYSRDSGSNNELVNFISSFFLNKIKIDIEYAWVRKALSSKDSLGGSIRMNMPVDESFAYQFLFEQADEINGLARQRLFVISGSKKLMPYVKLKIGVGLMQNWQTSYANKDSDQAMFSGSLVYNF